MNIRDLQYLIAVYQLGSFSKAADACFVSQPTLSGQLKKLEQELGAPLIERSTRSVIFTDLGKRVVSRAQQVLQGVQDIKELAQQAQDAFCGDFHLATIPTIGPYLLPRIMPLLTHSYPKVTFYLHELQTRPLLDKLAIGEIDCAILAKLDPQPQFVETSLFEEAFLLASASSDELVAKNKKVALDVLQGRELLMLQDGHCLREQALGVCFSAGANEDHRYQATSMDTLLHMVASGRGSTLVPHLASLQAREGVHYIKFKDPQPKREVIMLSRDKSVRKELLTSLALSISNHITRELEAV